MRRSLIWLHRWAGLVTGLVVLVVCLSGTALAFSDEYRMWRFPDRYLSSGGWPDSMSALLESAGTHVAEGSVPTSVIFAPSGEAPARVFFRAPDGERSRVYMHPDGTLVESSTGSTRDLMSVMLDVHRTLLGGTIGRTIVGISTIVFVVILLTGIPIWWPKTWKALRRGVSIKWSGANAARRIYDLHVSLGAWSAVLLVVMGVTGVFFAYDDTQDIIYTITGSERAPAAPESGTPSDDRANIDAVLADVRAHSPEPYSVFLVYPSSETAAIRALVFENDHPHPSAFDTFYYDQYSGESLGTMTYASLSRGERIRRSLFPFHTGEWNLATKTLWAFLTFLGATFPVTGFLMWFRKRRRKKEREATAPEPSAQPAPRPQRARGRRTPQPAAVTRAGSSPTG